MTPSHFLPKINSNSSWAFFPIATLSREHSPLGSITVWLAGIPFNKIGFVKKRKYVVLCI